MTKEELNEIIAKYNRGEDTGYTDEEYDIMLEQYLVDHPDEVRPFTRQKQSDNINGAVGTLDKIYGIRVPMRQNQKTYEKDWFHKFGDCDVAIQPKYDGTSVAIDFQTKRLFTRGDYDNGESVDVTDIFEEHIPLIDSFAEYFRNIKTIRFECIMEQCIYESMFANKYGRARDAVAACITSRNKDMAHYISLIPLRVYTNEGVILGLGDYEMLPSDEFEAMEKFIENILRDSAMFETAMDICPYISDKEDYYHSKYACDGVVLSRITGDYDAIDDLFESVYIDPNCEVACKILNIVKETKLKDIEWWFGKSGRVTPVANVEPVFIEEAGVTVTNVNLSTFERVKNMNLRYGDTVSIMYNIVPFLMDSKHDGTLPIPLLDKCPKCGHPLDTHNLKQIICTNPLCEGRLLGSIVRYCDKIGVFGVSSNTIEKLYENGYIQHIRDLYTMDLMEACEISGLGEKSLSNMINSIKKASTGISVHRWLGALPCDAVSSKKWKTLLDSIYGPNNPEMINDIINLCHEDSPRSFLDKMLWNTNGIGPATVASINSGIMNCWEDVNTIIDYITFEDVHNIKGVVCLSGTRDENIIELLENNGYEVTESWNKKCIGLVVPDPMFESKKVQMCKIANKPIFTINEVKNGALA